MCGRYTMKTVGENELVSRILTQAGFDGPLEDIRPTDAAPIITFSDGKIRAKFAYWGLPSPDDHSKPVINSRSETAEGKRFFREALHERRCIIPATGFYEWSRETKLKYLFNGADNEIIYMAGAYNEYGAIKKFVIFTRDADDDIKDIHNRMPVLIPKEHVREYLCEFSFYEKAFIAAPERIRRTLVSSDDKIV